MQTLAIQLALNGTAVLLISLLAGLLLCSAILRNGHEAACDAGDRLPTGWSTSCMASAPSPSSPPSCG